MIQEYTRERLDTLPQQKPVVASIRFLEEQSGGLVPGHLPSARLVLGFTTLDIGRVALGTHHADPCDTQDCQNVNEDRGICPRLRGADCNVIRQYVGRSRGPLVGCGPSHCMVEAGRTPCSLWGTRTGHMMRQSYVLTRRVMEEHRQAIQPHHSGYGPTAPKQRAPLLAQAALGRAGAKTNLAKDDQRLRLVSSSPLVSRRKASTESPSRALDPRSRRFRRSSVSDSGTGGRVFDVVTQALEG